MKRIKTFAVAFCVLAVLMSLAAVLSGCSSEKAGAQESTFPEFTSFEDLKAEGVRLGVLTGTTFDAFTAAHFPNAAVDYCDTMSDMAYCTKIGELDGFASDEPVAKVIVRETGGLTILPERLDRIDYAFLFAKDDKGAKLSAEVSEFIRKRKADGELSKIIDAWESGDTEHQVWDRSSLTGENGTIRLGVSATFEPFVFMRNGEIVGIDVDLLTRFCREKGYRLEIIDMAASALVASVGTLSDIAGSGLSITEERKELHYFSEPYYEGGTVMVVRNGEAAEKSGFFASLAASFEKTFIREQRWKLILQGIGTTVYISVFSALIGTLLGFGLCLLRRVNNPIVRGGVTAYVRIMQGTPLVVLLMILAYLVFAGSGFSGRWVAIIGFSLNFGAYVSEIFRSGIESIDRGQTEAALAIGFTRPQTFFRIVMPQAAMKFLPVYKGEFVSLVKMTSIVGYIAVQDLTKMSDIIRSRTYEAFFPLIATALIYFVIASLLTTLLTAVEVKIQPNRKNRTVKGVVTK